MIVMFSLWNTASKLAVNLASLSREEAERADPLAEIHGQVPGGLGDPLPRRVGGHPQEVDPAGPYSITNSTDSRRSVAGVTSRCTRSRHGSSRAHPDSSLAQHLSGLCSRQARSHDRECLGAAHLELLSVSVAARLTRDGGLETDAAAKWGGIQAGGQSGGGEAIEEPVK